MTRRLTTVGKTAFALINFVGVCAFLWSGYQFFVLEAATFDWWGYAALFAVTIGSGFLSVKIPGMGSLINLSDTFVFLAVLFFGPAPAAVLAAVDGFFTTRRHTGKLLSALSSLSIMAVSVLTAGWVFYALLKANIESASIDDIALPLGAMALTHYVINSAGVATMTALIRRMSIFRTWKDNFLWTSLTFFAGASAAAIVYITIQNLGPAAFIVIVPILAITYYSYRVYLGRVADKNRHIAEMNKVHLETIEALAMAIDAKGQTTYGHLRRVQAYCVYLAELKGVDDQTLEAIRAAALLHDVGKIGVPDYILNKPGPLTPAERRKVQTYPRIGAEILGRVQFPYPVVPLIRYHKERWDGTGYPEGLAGQQIPLGARIITLGDCIDSMLSARPWRPALGKDELLRYVKGQSGSAFDPEMVDLVLKNFDAMQNSVQAIEMPEDDMHEIRDLIREHAESIYEQERHPGVLSNITSAHQEALALYDLARDLGSSLSLEDTLSKIMGKLRSLIAFNTGVIYLFDDKGQLIVPKYVDGDNKDRVYSRTLRRGEGITGWVVENVRTMVNAKPELDFYGTNIEIGKSYASAAVVPLISDGLCMGTITLYDARENHFDSEDERILDQIAPQVATAIKNARSFEETRDRAMTDVLTGLPNSRFLYMQLDQEVSRARRNNKPLGVVVLDLDGFKPVNDNYGHHVGDEVLRVIANELKHLFRASDLVCRWAGDEFAALLPETTPEMVEETVQRVQIAIDELQIPTGTGRSVSVGVSAGWAVFPYDGGNFDDLMKVADRRMYEDKAERKEKTGIEARR